MALATISETLDLPATGSRATLRQTRVRLRLLAAADGQHVAYASAATVVAEATTRVANDGSYSFTSVRPNSGSSGDQITTPSESVYELAIIYPDATKVVRYLDVPDSTGPHDPADIEVNAPSQIKRWRVTDLYDASSTAADTDGRVLVWNDSSGIYEPTTAGTASITDDAVNDAKIDHTVAVNTQGSRWDGLRAWEAAWADVENNPVRMVCLRDSHGALGVDKPFFTRCRSRVPFRQDEPNALSGAGQWVPAWSSSGALSGTNGSHSGSAESSDGPAGYAAEIDTGDWVQFGGWAFTRTTGYTLYGVGDFDISVNGGGASSVTLAAGESWNTGDLTLDTNEVKVTATSDGSLVWGAYAHLQDRTAGFQNWNLAHSGWKGSDMVAADKTWDLITDLDPALVLVGFGTNQTSAADYLTDLQAVIDEVVTAAPNASLVLWFPHLSSGDSAWWADAEKYAKQLARANGAVLVNLYPVMGSLVGAADVFDLSSDDAHYTSKGNNVASQVLSGVLLGEDLTMRYVDATGVKPASALQLVELNTGAGNVTLRGGSFTSTAFHGAATNTAGSALAPWAVADEDGTSGKFAMNRDSGDARYTRRTLTEESDPSAPSSNEVTIYARDSGGGKTQLCARFATGAVQVIATEP